MALPNQEESLANARAKYEDLCMELNMDRETEETSWAKFQEVSQKFNLDGDIIHWFCCALYAAGRESYVPSVGGPQSVVTSNCVSFNKLLRCCNLSISQFLLKIKSWHEMANTSKGFLEQINKLEHTLGITVVLFHHYNDIFERLFLSPRNEKKNLKNRSVTKCSSTKLYDMCWCLYLCAKNENPQCTVDIVTPFHLLLCCIDLIYRNVLAENRTDLINPSFEGVPDNWNTADFDRREMANYCIIDSLCKQIPAIPEHAKEMKDIWWRSIIINFLETNTIYGDCDTFLDILSSSNYERNFKSLNNVYEQYILSVGGFDERILLTRKVVTTGENSESHRYEPQLEFKSLIPDTPYTRKYLPTKEMSISEPVANAMTNVRKLQDIAHITEPLDLIRQASDKSLRKIKDELHRMSNLFNTKFPNKPVANKRFDLAKSLYYYLLEKIVRHEKQVKPHIDLEVLLENEYHSMLIACCVEIVLDAYNSQLKFPWVLDCFSINAFNFCKIIEIVVRGHGGILTRALIKHLNTIEETCLESLAWQKTSPLWDLREMKAKEALPTWSEVDVGNHSKRNEPQLQSPTDSTYETFGAVPDPAKRDSLNANKEATNINEKLRRAGPLSIFLRKFYQVGWLRIKKLCIDLSMGDEEYLNKIWTLFEYSITNCKELMKGRHLDQLLMCAVYLYVKVAEINKRFTDIMKDYRNQPQATSSTYRQVLISSDSENGTTEDTEKYGDIIYFYNKIYVQKMTDFAMNFREKKESFINLKLSPHPTEIRQLPKQLSHSLSVHTMEKNEFLHSPKYSTYEFGKSPGQELERFNELVNRGFKRSLPFNDPDPAVNSSGKISRESSYCLNSAIKGIIQSRQEEIN